MNENLLMIFTRNPELGKVKTRLAKSLGDESALTIYKMLLDKTKEVTQNLSCDKAVFYSVKVRDNDIWDNKIYHKYSQEGKDLGERMHNAFKEAFKKGYKKVAIIGSDLFDLKASCIDIAFQQLGTNDVVVGPANDGGYYLLACKNEVPEIFKDKNWGSDTVLTDTLSDLKNHKVFQLEVLNDIDYAEDLEPYEIFKPFIKLKNL